MLLLVDIGNSFSKFKIDNTNIVFSLKTSSYETVDDLKKLFPIEHLDNVTEAIISSVSLNKDNLIKEYLKEEKGIDSIIIKNVGMKYLNDYPTVNNELGSDLVAIMEGASLSSNTHITISLGTASVFNLVIDKKYIGTSISPGVFSSFKGLVESTSLFKLTELDKESKVLGFNTEEALASGVLNGFSYLIDVFINSIKEEYNLKNVDVYIFGGFASTFSKLIKNKVILDNDLIYKGLSNLYKLNS